MIGRSISYDKTNPSESRRRRQGVIRAWPAVAAGAVVALGLLFSVARGQNPYPGEVILSSRPLASTFTLRAERNLVEVRVVVRDAKGKAVDILQQADFELLDNGKEQEISSFSVLSPELAPPAETVTPPPNPSLPAAPLPETQALARRFVLLYFDDLHLTDEHLTFLRQAAQKFAEHAAAPGTYFAVSTSSGHDRLGFTQDAEKLRATIFAIGPRSQLTINPNDCPPITPYQAFLIVNGDPTALELAIQQCKACDCPQEMLPSLAQQIWELTRQESEKSVARLESGVKWLAAAPGQRVLVLVSPGFLSRAPECELRLNEVIDHALRSNVVINSLDASGLSVLPSASPSVGRVIYLRGADYLNAYVHTMELGEIAQKAETLEAPANGTGGTVFRNSNDLALGFQQLAGTPEAAYLLAFSPSNLKANGAFHKLAVRVAGPANYTIESRRGYFAPREGAGPQVIPDKALRREIFGHDKRAEIPVTVSLQPSRGYGFVRTLWVKVHVSVGGIPFRRERSRNLEKLTFTTVLLGPKAELVAGKQGTMEFRLEDGTRQSLATTGATAVTFLEAPQGSYRLREIVTESERGLTTVVERPADIP